MDVRFLVFLSFLCIIMKASDFANMPVQFDNENQINIATEVFFQSKGIKLVRITLPLFVAISGRL